jgi:hypothetical protein
MSGVPYVFGNATTSIPLSQLDVNFATNATIGTTSVGLGNTTTTLVGLTNVSTTVVNTSNVSANTSLLLQTNGTTTALTLDTNQNVGVGVTPSAWSGWGVPVIEAPTGGTFVSAGNGNVIGSNWYYAASNYTYKTTNAASYYYQVNGQHRWFNAPSGTAGSAITFTQAMTLDGSGHLGLGTTSIDSGAMATIQAVSGGNGMAVKAGTNGNYGIYFNNVANTTLGGVIINSGTIAYTGTSDYRLKDITGAVTGAKDFIMALQPKQGTWKADGSKFVGFLAHEFQEVSPSSVYGDKDAVQTIEIKDEKGNVIGTEEKPIYQVMDASSSEVMANLVSFIQELSAQVTTLQTQVTALQTKVGV